jgi:hypothetical protein
MKKVLCKGLSIAILILVFAVGFSMGRSTGFETGSTWALKQADIVAREAGLFMPVYLRDGSFRVVIKQRRGIYKRAWELADKHDETQGMLRTAKLETVLVQNEQQTEVKEGL